MKRGALVLALIAVCAAPAAAAPPDNDPFYSVPAGIEHLANGTIIDSREVTVTQFSAPINANAWQVRFKTEDNTGAPTAYITTVIVPRAPWAGPGPRPVLSYQMPEDGVGLKCAPSYVLTTGLAAPSNTTPDAQTVAAAVDRGWIVVVPDYEGPQSMWLGADGQARGVLDSLRAARAFKAAGIDPRAPIGLWGYSGGAIASSTAAQLQPSYAPDIKVAGVALGGNNGSIRAGLQAFDGSLFGGAIVIGFIGLDRAYPEYHLADYLNNTGRAAVAQSQDDCIADAVLKHPLFRASDALKDPGALDGPVWSEVFRRASPLTFPGTPDAPVYDYHATGDELAPIGPDHQLTERYCQAGVTVQRVENPGDHFTEVALGEDGAMGFLADRFAGRPPTNTCGARPNTSPPTCESATQMRVTRVRITPRSVVVRGTASAKCDTGARTVMVALSRVIAGRCRFLDRGGRLGRPRSCSRPVGLRAQGTTRWTLSLRAALQAGRYAIYLWSGASPNTTRLIWHVHVE
jgi:hypothetical protein